MAPTRYYVVRDNNERAQTLARVRWSDKGMHGECWIGDEWVENIVAIHCYWDGIYADQIEEEEVPEIQKQLKGH